MLVAGFTAEDARARQALARANPPVIERVVQQIVDKIRSIPDDEQGETYCVFEPTAVQHGAFHIRYASSIMKYLHLTEGGVDGVVRRLSELGYAVTADKNELFPEYILPPYTAIWPDPGIPVHGFNVCWDIRRLHGLADNEI